MTAPSIRAEGLTKLYRLDGPRPDSFPTFAGALASLASRRRRAKATEFAAVDDVSFEARPGDVLGLIGANGAGKSTVLKMLSRIVAPTVGRIELNGRVASLLEVGTGFHPELTGRENVHLNGAILGMSRRETARKFDEIVAFSGVERFLDMPVKRYSSGMYVRLAFAVAAHLDPEILLVDEVLAVGDAAFQRKCMEKMNAVAEREGRTIVFVSHGMTAVQRLCNRAIVLEGGRVAFEGGVEEAVRRHLSAANRAAGRGTDLRARPRKGRPGDPRLARCATIGADGTPSALLRVGEPFAVHVEIEASRDADDALLSVGIETLGHVRVATMRSEEAGARIPLRAGRCATIRVRVDEPCLAPGSYVVALHLRVGGRHVDSTSMAASFDVAPTAYDAGGAVDDAPGVVKLRARWEAAEALAP